MYKITNLHKAIRSHSVFIQNLKSKEKDIGSGVFVKIENRYFVLSAAHVIEDDIDISLGLYTPKTRFTVIQKWLDKENDVGYIELKESEAVFLRNELSFPYTVGATHKEEVKSRSPIFAICGFPRALANDKKTHFEVPIMFQKVAILAPDQYPEPYKKSLNSDKNIVVIYGQKRGGILYDINKNPMEPTDPHGFSGCGLWLINSLDENDEKPNYSLVGILRAYDEFYQILLCTTADIVLNKIVENYKINIPALK